MARLRSIIKGIRQLRPIDVPLKNMINEGAPATVTAALRVLGGDEYGEILKLATRYAVDRGAKPEPGVELYDYAKAVYTVAIAVVDAESDPANPSPFFGDSDNPSVEERALSVLSHPNIGRDTILYLAECQDVWQDECSPQYNNEQDWARLMAEVTADGPLALLKYSAGTRLRFTAFLVSLQVLSLELNSGSGSTSVAAG